MFNRKHWKKSLIVVLSVLVVGGAFGLLTQNVLLGQTTVGTKLHVAGMGVTYKNTGGPNRLAVAAVSVQDELGNLINGALVEGNWSGCFSYADSATTETVTYPNGTVVNGRANIWANKSNSCWGKNGCTWTFTVTKISKTGMTYDPTANVKTTASYQCQ